MLKNSDYYALREIDIKEELPWDFIKYNKDKNTLKAEYVRLMNIE